MVKKKTEKKGKKKAIVIAPVLNNQPWEAFAVPAEKILKKTAKKPDPKLLKKLPIGVNPLDYMLADEFKKDKKGFHQRIVIGGHELNDKERKEYLAFAKKHPGHPITELHSQENGIGLIYYILCEKCKTFESIADVSTW